VKPASKYWWWMAGGLCALCLALFCYFTFFNANDPNGRWRSDAWITTSNGEEGEVWITDGK